MRIPRESWFDDDEFNFFYWVEQSLSSLKNEEKLSIHMRQINNFLLKQHSALIKEDGGIICLF